MKETIRLEGEPAMEIVKALLILKESDIDVEVLTPHSLALIGPAAEVLNEIEQIGGILLHNVELFPAKK